MSEISAFYATSTVVGIAPPATRDPALDQATTNCTTSLFPAPTSGATFATLPATTGPGYSSGISTFCDPTPTVSMLTFKIVGRETGSLLGLRLKGEGHWGKPGGHAREIDFMLLKISWGDGG